MAGDAAEPHLSGPRSIPRGGAPRSRHRRRASFFAATAAALCLAGPPAAANGRFPGATQLVIRGERAVMTSSFGVITSGDRFATTTWACEASLGYDPAQNNDLGAGIFANGSVVLSGPLGLSVSLDRACSNPRPGGPVDAVWMSDVSVDEKTKTTGIAVARGPRDGACAGELFETKDEGRTWAAIGAKLPPGFCAFTVDSAPSDDARIYVSGNVPSEDGKRLVAQLLVSDDRGATWTARTIPDESLPFIGALDPLDRDVVYVRTSSPPATGHLLVSTDAGQTFRRIASLTGVALQFFGVTGIAVSPDGSKVAYGSVNEGLFVIEGRGGEPQQRNSLPVLCLTWSDDGLYACSAPNLCGPFFVGRSADEGRSFAPVLPSLDIGGDRTTCDPSTPTASSCPAQWSALKTRLRGCGDDAGVPVDGGPTDAGPPAPAPAPPSLDCDCDSAPRGAAPSAAALGVAALALVALGRRRRR